MPKSKGVLGGADYLTLLMGGRRKVDKEAKKLLSYSSAEAAIDGGELEGLNDVNS